MSDDEPRVQITLTLSEYEELARWLNLTPPAIVHTLLDTWMDIQASIERGIDG